MGSFPTAKEVRALSVVDQLRSIEEEFRAYPDDLDRNVRAFIQTAITSIEHEINRIKEAQ